MKNIFTFLQKARILQMKKCMQIVLNKLSPKYISSYTKALLITITILSITWITNPIFFETNDDTGIMAFVAGFKTGTPTAGTIFCNLIWGGVISFLYDLNAHISWYPLVYMALTVISLSILCHFCLKTFSSNIIWPISVLFFLWLFLSFFLFHCVGFQFTTMSAICGMGGILLACFPEECKNISRPSKKSLVRIFSFTILFIFACNIRPKIGYMVCLGLLCAYVINRFLFKVKISSIYVYIGIIIAAFSYIANQIWEYMHGWEAFRAYHKQRVLWTDYPRVTFSENPELYKSVGWSDKLYNLADQWFFIDENINENAFAVINKASLNLKGHVPIKQQIIDTLKYIFNVDQMITISICSISIIMLWIFFIAVKQKKKNVLLGLCIYISVGMSLLFYFSWKGRLLYRITDSIIFVFWVPGIIFSLKLLFENINVDLSSKIPLGCPIAAIVLMGIFVMEILFSILSPSGLAQVTHNNAVSESRKIGEHLKERMENYAIQHQENLYIYDNSLAVVGNPFTTHPDQKPYNLIFWGGSGMYSPLHYDQLHANGMESLYPDDFFEKNIFFIGTSEPNVSLTEYMNDRFDGCDCGITDQQDGFIIYQFKRNGERQ